jgi:hypothetical protein
MVVIPRVKAKQQGSSRTSYHIGGRRGKGELRKKSVVPLSAGFALDVPQLMCLIVWIMQNCAVRNLVLSSPRLFFTISGAGLSVSGAGKLRGL